MTLITNTTTANPSSPITVWTNLEAQFNRPADTTAYVADDVISDDAVTAKAIVFPGAGSSGRISQAMVLLSATPGAAIGLQLLVFDAEPTNLADNAALALLAADASRLVGVYNFVDANKTTLGASGLVAYRTTGALGDQTSSPFAYSTVNGNLYGLLVVKTLGFTPAASTTVTIRLSVERT